MNINATYNPSFKQLSYQNEISQKKLQTFSPKTNKEANEYILEADKFTHALPSEEKAWDRIYSLPLQQKLNLVDTLKLTHNYHKDNPYPHYSAILAPVEPYAKTLDDKIRTDGILSEEEIQRFYKKTIGHFPVISLITIGPDKFSHDKENTKENLSFIKTLMTEENNDIFEIMHPITLISLLLNHHEYNCFNEKLNALKEKNVVQKEPLEAQREIDKTFFYRNLFDVIPMNSVYY